METPDGTASIVIPAFNEALRIGRVLSLLAESGRRDEVLVVNDGSWDATAEAASAFPFVKLIDLAVNCGKGAAMAAGAREARSEVLLFLDADLEGLACEHVERLIRPVARGGADMTLGIFRSGRARTDLGHVLGPWITGQRAMRREDFLSVPGVAEARFGVETMLTRYALLRRMRIEKVILQGVTHPTKEEKLGLVRGLVSRAAMYGQIARVLLLPSTNHRRSLLNAPGSGLTSAGQQQLRGH